MAQTEVRQGGADYSRRLWKWKDLFPGERQGRGLGGKVEMSENGVELPGVGQAQEQSPRCVPATPAPATAGLILAGGGFSARRNPVYSAPLSHRFY